MLADQLGRELREGDIVLLGYKDRDPGIRIGRVTSISSEIDIRYHADIPWIRYTIKVSTHALTRDINFRKKPQVFTFYKRQDLASAISHLIICNDPYILGLISQDQI